MGVPLTRPLGQHTQTSYVQGQIMRAPSPWFAPPVPNPMREPGTNYLSIITAEGNKQVVSNAGLGPQIMINAENKQVPTFRPTA